MFLRHGHDTDPGTRGSRNRNAPRNASDAIAANPRSYEQIRFSDSGNSPFILATAEGTSPTVALPPTLSQYAPIDVSILSTFGENLVENRVHRELLHLAFFGVFDHLAFTVDRGGTVTLARRGAQSQAQGRCGFVVANLDGVAGVVNLITLLPDSPADNRVRLAVFRAIYGHRSYESLCHNGRRRGHPYCGARRQGVARRPGGIECGRTQGSGTGEQTARGSFHHKSPHYRILLKEWWTCADSNCRPLPCEDSQRWHPARGRVPVSSVLAASTV